MLLLNPKSNATTASGSSAFSVDPDTDGFIPVSKIYTILSELRRILGECMLYERSSSVKVSASGVKSASLARDCPDFTSAGDVAFYLSHINLGNLLNVHKTEKKIYIQTLMKC